MAVNNKSRFLLASAFFLNIASIPSFAQNTAIDTVKAQPFDMGKMWTFENPPADYFKNTYNIAADDKWFQKAQLAALRFATYCSASFVSSNGLVMTNHHCARESGVAVQKKGEDFSANGFYAAKPSDERKVPDLFVDQLVKIEDITQRVQSIESQGETDSEKIALREEGLENIVKEYRKKEEWKDLEVQAVTLYSGGKFSLYGFKRYNDVRLVFMPELDLGFFGGDPDNFTYPRYNLDVSFFRVYDEKGKPLHSPDYFRFNPDGIRENEPVFVIGNPGSTGRLLTTGELEMERDFKLPYLIEALKNRSGVLAKYNLTAKSDSITNEIFSYENGIKSFGGQLKGMQDPYLMARKKAFEDSFRKKVRANPELSAQYAIWDNISEETRLLRTLQNDLMLLQPNPLFRGELLVFAQQLIDYALVAESNPERSATLKGMLKAFTPKVAEIEIGTLASHFEEAKLFMGVSDEYVNAAFNGKSSQEAAQEMYSTTRLMDSLYVKQLVEKGGKAILNSDDPFLRLAAISQPRYMQAVFTAREAHARLEVLQGKLGRLLFDTYGTSIPPDATMSLRINDGVVKGFEYNGTDAPVNTTFYGLYDRFNSYQGKSPWSLPERWKNPSVELLKSPLNFVSTNDIIGGNSGSPIVNSKLEAVGLAFDGNMESLPGYFIFAPDRGNRTVSVHVGGIVAALRHVYKAKRLTDELVP